MDLRENLHKVITLAGSSVCISNFILLIVGISLYANLLNEVFPYMATSLIVVFFSMSIEMKYRIHNPKVIVRTLRADSSLLNLR